MSYAFRPVTLDDLPLLNRWLAAEHVRRWWGEDARFAPEDLDEPRVAYWIVCHAGRPFGYIQDYRVHGWEGGHHFDHLPHGARGIDQYIGEAAMLGQGHGTAFIGAHIRRLRDAGAPVIATDPHPDNARAIAVYRKLGFAEDGPPKDTAWGRVLPMVLGRGP